MLQSIKNISSYVQCKSLNVWSVYFFFDTLSCQNYFFQGVWEVYKIIVEIPEGWGGGGYFSGQNLEIPERSRGLHEIPSVVGVRIFSGTTHCSNSGSREYPSRPSYFVDSNGSCKDLLFLCGPWQKKLLHCTVKIGPSLITPLLL